MGSLAPVGDVVEDKDRLRPKGNARGADEKEGRTHEVPEDDVSGEYLGKAASKSGSD